MHLSADSVRAIVDALHTSARVLDSAAFVSQPGDTEAPLLCIAHALSLLGAASIGEHCSAVQTARSAIERSARAAAGLHAIADGIATMQPDDEPAAPRTGRRLDGRPDSYYRPR